MNLLKALGASTYPGNEATCVEIARYALFSGANFYAGGGWEDFVFLFEDLARASEHGADHARKLDEVSGSWWHVVDLLSGEIVGGGVL